MKINRKNLEIIKNIKLSTIDFYYVKKKDDEVINFLISGYSNGRLALYVYDSDSLCDVMKKFNDLVLFCLSNYPENSAQGEKKNWELAKNFEEILNYLYHNTKIIY